jgi:hypothetical protein
MLELPKSKVAAVQATPVFFDTEATAALISLTCE